MNNRTWKWKRDRFTPGEYIGGLLVMDVIEYGGCVQHVCFQGMDWLNIAAVEKILAEMNVKEAAA